MSGHDRQAVRQAAELAEQGRFEQALGLLQGFLREQPNDAEALNDAGTILYCLHRGREAIEYFQKARSLCSGDMLTQVLFNLCEAYIAEHQPEKAVGLLDEMADREILNVDILNRIANCFVDKGSLGPAIEMLLYSLRLAPNQEILRPMIEIIRSKRVSICLYAEQQRRLEGLRGYLEARYPLSVCTGGTMPAVPEGGHSRSISIFTGISRAFLDERHRDIPAVLVLDYEDLNHPALERIDWAGVRAVLVPSQSAAEQIRLRLGGFPSSVQLLTMGPGVDAETVVFAERRKGKRLAAVGPWTAHQNPMFLLHCMQKLHYLDADMRLHLAGEFEDESVRAYVESLIEAMGLENVVFLDGVPRSWARWLKDKHYIVSASVDGRSMPSVLQGMAAGLRPVVHHFPGVCEYVEKEFVFVLAEDFCRQILEGAYEPMRYRTWVLDRFSPIQAYLPLVRILSELERSRLFVSSGAGSGSPMPGSVQAAASRPLEPAVSVSSPISDRLQPSEPAAAGSQPAVSASIEELAHRALEAAQRLKNSGKSASSEETEAVCSCSGRSPSAAPF
ncbi:MAG: glycosyltransferase [Anaerohalosphaeraceae bacterium]